MCRKSQSFLLGAGQTNIHSYHRHANSSGPNTNIQCPYNCFYVCTVHFAYRFNSTNNALYFFYFNNIYIIIAPTYFDTFVSSSGSSKIVQRCYVVSILLNFN
jgi:hypothetical protein